MLDAEEIELDDDAAVGEAQQAILVEDRTVDMADDGALGIAAIRGDEIGDLLRLVVVAAGMDIERGTGLALRDQGAAHDAFFERRPRRLAADLADDAGTDVGAPGAVAHLADHLAGEIVDGALGVARILVLLDIVAAAHHDIGAGARRYFGKTGRIGLQAAAGQLDHRSTAGGDHSADLVDGDIELIEPVFRAMLDLAVVDRPDGLERDLRLGLVAAGDGRRVEIA